MCTHLDGNNPVLLPAGSYMYISVRKKLMDTPGGLVQCTSANLCFSWYGQAKAFRNLQLLNPLDFSM
jgi:hypothetical protein